MIFITVGTDMPFDRLIRTVDQWARSSAREDCFAQIGEGGWRPSHIRHSEFLEPPEFKRLLAEARIVIAHAGMGTILSALQAEKPLLVMPRHAALGEQRNDHQIATARELERKLNLAVAYDETDLLEHLDRVDELMAAPPIAPFAGADLQGAIRDFIVSFGPSAKPQSSPLLRNNHGKNPWFA